MTLGLTVFFGVFVVSANFVIDLIYGLVDPRGSGLRNEVYAMNKTTSSLTGGILSACPLTEAWPMPLCAPVSATGGTCCAASGRTKSPSSV